jgi:Cu/Zn superoxide dismutase
MKRFLVLLACCGWLAACSNWSLRSPTATAALAPTKGSQTAGNVTFIQKGDKVLVDARVTGLTPGLHGFHVHDKGDCTAPDGTSAGRTSTLKTPHAGRTARSVTRATWATGADSGVAVYHAGRRYQPGVRPPTASWDVR